MSWDSPDLTTDGLVGEDFARMVDVLRRMQNAMMFARPPADLLRSIETQLAAIGDALETCQVPERDRVAGRLWDVPGRGQALVPAITLTTIDDDHRAGHVSFTKVHLGSGGVVNGGVIPLVFVDVLGLLANAGDRPFSRMASVKVDFKAPVFIDTTVMVDARIVGIEGRKVRLSGRLYDGDVDFAFAEALFLLPRPADAIEEGQ